MFRSIVAAWCLVCVLPASACDTGPWPVGFRYGSPMPNKDGALALAGIAETLKMSSPTDSIRIIVYNPGVSSPSLWKARLNEARTRLVKYGVTADRIAVVPLPTRRGTVAGEWIGRATKMTVELAKGCGG